MRIAHVWVVFLTVVLLASCASRSVESRFGSYAEAERLYQKGDYGRAADHYEKYLKENPQGNLVAVASYYLARSYVAVGETDAARKVFRSVVEDHPKTTWADFSKKQLESLGI